jgi:hypothetical protein
MFQSELPGGEAFRPVHFPKGVTLEGQVTIYRRPTQMWVSTAYSAVAIGLQAHPDG